MLKKQYLFYIYIIFVFLNFSNVLAYVKRQDSTNSTVSSVTTPIVSNPTTDINSDPTVNNNNNNNNSTSSDIITDPSNDNTNNDNNNDPNNVPNDDIVKSTIESIYGSVQIEYVKLEKEDNFNFKLFLYLAIIISMIVLVCLVHVAVWMRPKIIKKRTDKRKSRNITASETNTLIMSSRNNSMNNFGMEELKDVKLKNESPEEKICWK